MALDKRALGRCASLCPARFADNRSRLAGATPSFAVLRADRSITGALMHDPDDEEEAAARPACL